MHCLKDDINNRKYILHFIRLLLPPKSPILPNLGGDPYCYCYCYCRCAHVVCTAVLFLDAYLNTHYM